MIGTDYIRRNKIKILITGASGFIGKNFLELAPKDVEIIAIYNTSEDIRELVEEKKLNNIQLYKCNLAKREKIEQLFEKIGNNFECCIYLAGNVDVPLSIKDPLKDLDGNAGILLNFLQSCGKINKFIYMSSAAVYDGVDGTVTVNTHLDPTVPYCVSKLICEQYIKYFSKTGKINNYIILRFGGAYGKYSRASKFVDFVVNKIYVQNKKIIEVYGDGTNKVNIMYAKDTVKALVRCIDSEKSNVICNLGQGTMTVTEVVQRIAKTFSNKVKIKYTPRIKEQKYIFFELDVDFNKVFDFKPDYSFERGIKEFGDILKNER